MKDVLGYRVLNRSGKLPDNGWYHIAPEGEFPHPSGVTQVLDRQSIDAMVNAFRDQEKEEGDHFPGLLVDFDHFSNDPKAPSEAAGWIHDLQNRAGEADPKDNGLWAQIDWSDIGESAVKGKRYRLVSPVWNRGDCEELGKDRIRPLRLDRIALTNDPNLKGMNPLTNRDEPAPDQKDETFTTTARAATKPQCLLNDGTSEGARKGWITRKGGIGAAPRMATKTDLSAQREITQHPTYKRAIEQGASHEVAMAEARGDIAHDKEMKAGQAAADAFKRRAATKADLKAPHPGPPPAGSIPDLSKTTIGHVYRHNSDGTVTDMGHYDDFVKGVKKKSGPLRIAAMKAEPKHKKKN